MAVVSLCLLYWSVCCSEIPQIQEKKAAVAVQCIVNHPGFQTVCLDVYVLQTAYYSYCQHYGAHAHQGAIHEYNSIIIINIIANTNMQHIAN